MPVYAPPPQQAYAPPPQQAYAPPPQQAYAPPPQQAYVPPPQQAYAPPPQQAYAPPPQQAYAPPAQSYAPPVDAGYAQAPPQVYAPPPPPAYEPFPEAPTPRLQPQPQALPPSPVASLIPQPAAVAPPMGKESLEDLPEKPAVKPSPRGIPEPRAPRGITVRHHTADASARAPVAPVASQRSPLATVARFIVPVLLVLSAGTVVYMVIDANRRAAEAQAFPNVDPGAAVDPATAAGLPKVDDPAAPRPKPVKQPDAAPAIPRPEPEPPPAPAPLPPDPAEVSGALEATRLIDKFLATTSLEERLPHFEPDLAAKDFEGSILTGVLPPHEGITPGLALRNEAEGFIDFPFVTTFRMPDASDRDLMIIARKRGTEPAKILVRPFFDLLDRRLDAFAAAPVEGKAREFFAVVEAIPRVFEAGIPGSEDKFTYKLSSSGTGPEILRAYASMKSPLAEQLYSAQSPLRWGIRLPCVITLEWNLTENPEQPFIELREVRSVNW
jgi:hypothetical protein